MAYCTTNCCEETPEAKTIRDKNREIDILKNVIVEQAKEAKENKEAYHSLWGFNEELRASKITLTCEKNNMCGRILKIKHILSIAQECANDTTKSQRQREISKIRVEALQEAINILEGDEEKC